MGNAIDRLKKRVAGATSITTGTGRTTTTTTSSGSALDRLKSRIGDPASASAQLETLKKQGLVSTQKITVPKPTTTLYKMGSSNIPVTRNVVDLTQNIMSSVYTPERLGQYMQAAQTKPKQNATDLLTAEKKQEDLTVELSKIQNGTAILTEEGKARAKEIEEELKRLREQIDKLSNSAETDYTEYLNQKHEGTSNFAKGATGTLEGITAALGVAIQTGKGAWQQGMAEQEDETVLAAREKEAAAQRAVDNFMAMNVGSLDSPANQKELTRLKDKLAAATAERKAAESGHAVALDMNTNEMRQLQESSWLKEEATKNLSPTGKFLANIGMSIAQNAALMPLAAINPALPLAAMGTVAGAQKMYEVGAAGGNAGDAFERGIVSGSIEALTEKIPLDTVMDLVKTGGKSAVKNLLKQAGIEATEEGLSYTMNYIADKANKDPNAAWSWAEFFESIASGGLSGMFFGLGGTTVNAATTMARENAIGEQLQVAGGLEQVELALAFADKASTIKQLETMQTKLKNGESVSAGTLGKVAIENVEKVQELLQEAQQLRTPEVARAVNNLVAQGNQSGYYTKAVVSDLRNAVVQAKAGATTLEAKATVTQEVNPEAAVQDAGTTLYLQIGMSLKKAQEKAAIVQKLIDGEEVSKLDLNKINLTDKTYQQVFTQLTGVEFPANTKLSTEALRNLAESAHTVAQQKQEAQKQQAKAVEAVQNIQAQQAANAPAAEMPVGGNAQTGFVHFMGEAQQQFPHTSPEQLSAMYSQFVNGAKAVTFAGRSVNREQFVQLMRSIPGGQSLSQNEMDAMFNRAILDTLNGKDGAERYALNPAQRSRMVTEEGNAALRASQDALAQRWGNILKKFGITEVRFSDEMADNENASYQDGVVTFNRNRITDETMLAWTLGHELVHSIRDAGQRKAFVDDVIGTFEVLGEVKDTQKEVDRLRRAYEKHTGKALDDDYIREELAADLMRDAFLDRDMMEKLGTTKPSLLYRAKQILKRLLGQTDDKVAREAMENLQNRLLDAIRVTEANATYESGHTVTNEKGEPVAQSDEDGSMKFSLRTYDESGREVLSGWLKKAVKSKKLTKEEADDILRAMDDIYRVCQEAREDYAPFNQWSDAKVVTDTDGHPVSSVVKKNGDYAMNLDFSTVCKKRRTLDAVLNELIARGDIEKIQFDEEGTNFVRINDIIREHGFETACALCFVDAKRFRQANVADTFVDMWNGIVKSIAPKDAKIAHFNFGNNGLVDSSVVGIEGMDLDLSALDKVMKKNDEKTVPYAIAKHLKENPQDRKLLMRGDFLSSEGFTTVSVEKPEILKLFNRKKGAGGPKSTFPDVQYLNEILRPRTFNVQKAYDVGGVRVQSFSDYVPRMVFDYVQMFGDLAAKKLPAHAYTKEELFVKQFGLTGIKINMSLVPAVVENGIAPGLDAEGNYVWADESFNYKEAKRIQNAEGYSRNCGTICVGISDEHIRKLLEDDTIRMVIPYHKSGLNHIIAAMNNIGQFEDYTNVQSTRYGESHGEKSGTKLDDKDIKTEPNFNQRLHKLGAKGDPRAVAEEYVRWCEENDYLPKFDQFAYQQIDGVFVEKDGKKVVDPNYYKLLVDFTVYDNGSYVPQEGVTMTFPTEESAFGSMAELIKRGLEEDAILEGKRSAEVGKIADEIEREMVPGKRYSIAYEHADNPAQMETLAVAKQRLAADPQSAEEIRRETGWWRSKTDGRWRFEIDDSEMDWKTDPSTLHGQTVRLGDVLEHTLLFQNYPAIADVMVAFDKPAYHTSNASFDPETNTIQLKEDFADTSETRRTLAHEIQHAIQRYEFKANYDDGVATEDNVQTGYNKWYGYESLFGAVYNRHKNKPAFTALKTYEDRVRYIEHEMAELERQLYPEYDVTDEVGAGRAGYDVYEHALGEVEATDVANRLGLTEEERKANPPVTAKKNKAVGSKDLIRSRELFETAHREMGWNGVDTKLGVIYNSTRKRGASDAEKGTIHSEERNGHVGRSFGRVETATEGDRLRQQRSRTDGRGLAGISVTKRNRNEMNPKASDDSGAFSLPETRYSLNDEGYAPTFYSHMGKVIDEMKMPRLGAANGINYLKGRGVKDEEIKWSGIEEFLADKKSVSKEELQKFVRNNQLEIEEEVLGDKDNIELTEKEQQRVDRYRQIREEAIAEIDKLLEDGPLDLHAEWQASKELAESPMGLGYIARSDFRLLGEAAENYYRKELRDRKEPSPSSAEWRVFVNRNDDFGFDNSVDPIRYILSDPVSVARNYDMSDEDKQYLLDFAELKKRNNKVAWEWSRDPEAVKLREIESWVDDAIAAFDAEERILEKAKKNMHRTRWKQYSTQGGHNYREILFRLPDSSYTNDAMVAHWKEGARGILAHARIQDFDTADGKMLFIEEIQSDWHNAKQKAEKKRRELQKAIAAHKAKEQQYKSIVNTLRDAGLIGGTQFFEDDLQFGSVERRRTLMEAMGEENTAFVDTYLKEKYVIINLQDEIDDAGPPAPDAPYSDTYHEFVLKRLLREAAEQGYDSIGWTTGKMQEERWDSKYAEGYRIEYDQDIPKFLSKYGKKWGAKVGQTYLDTNGYNPEDVREREMELLMALEAAREQTENTDLMNTDIDAFLANQRTITNIEETLELLKGTKVWTLPITDAMRESVLYEGQPKFSLSEMQDKAYMDAVNRGEMGQAQSLVDHRAEMLGYNIKLHHGTAGEPFYVFRQGAEGIHFGTLKQATQRAKTAEDRYGYHRRLYSVEDIRKNPGNYPDSARKHILDEIVHVLPVDFTREEMERAADLIYGDDSVSDQDLFRYLDRAERDANATSYHISNRDMQKNGGNRVVSAYVKAKNPLVFPFDIGEWTPPHLASLLIDKINGQQEEVWDHDAQEWVKRDLDTIDIDLSEADLPELERLQHSRDFGDMAAFLQSKGIDSICYLNTYEGTKDEESYILLSPEQVKSADPVTYDDNGNIIPLSERFNEQNEDIRYSITPEFEEWYLSQFPAEQQDHARANLDGARRWEQLQAQTKEGNFHPEGANGVREVHAPKYDFDEKPISKSVSTVMGAKAIPDDVVVQLQSMAANGDFSYGYKSDEKAIQKAKLTINSIGFDGAMERFRTAVNAGKMSKDIAVLGQVLLNNAANSRDSKAIAELMCLYQTLNTHAGQTLQAMSIFRKLEPESQLYGVQKMAEKLSEEIRKKHGKKAVDELADEYGVKIDQGLIDKFLSQTDQEGRDKVMDEIYQNIADQVPSTWMDKWNAWRYLAMLGNLRTHIRNIAGNALFQPVVLTKNVLATVMEAAAYHMGGKSHGMERSKTFTADPALYKMAWNDFGNAKEALEGNKYNDVQSVIMDKRKIFKFKPLEAVRKANTGALSLEDAIFKRITYTYSLASYLKSHGVKGKSLDQVSPELLSKARDYAGKEALKATYTDENALSSAVGRLSGLSKSDKAVVRAAGVVVEGALPFKKTPANILVRGLEYSPVGLAKGLTYDLVKVAKHEKTAAEAMDAIASGLSGSALFALGVTLAAMGRVTGGAGEDKDDEWAEQLGHQGYALELDDGTSVTLDWLAPEAIPFFMGVELLNAVGENGFQMDDIWTMTKQLVNPMMEMSMLQSLNDLLDTVSYSDSKLTDIVMSAMISYVSQAVPTIGGQIERTGEEERTSTYTDKNNKLIPSDVQYAIGKASAKIPGWDYQQVPYIDVWGRNENTGELGERAFNNFFSPAYTSQIEVDDVESELQRLRESLSDTVVYPSKAGRSVEYTMEDKETGEKTSVKLDLTAEQYITYATTLGQTRYSMLSDGMDTDAYGHMTDAEKAEYVSKVYTFANAVAKMAVSDYTTDDKWVHNTMNAQKEIGVSPAEFLTLYVAAGNLKSYKDNGETVDNSKSLRTAVMVYDCGYDKETTKKLLEALDVNKTVRGWNPNLARRKLEQMEKKYG